MDSAASVTTNHLAVATQSRVGQGRLFYPAAATLLLLLTLLGFQQYYLHGKAYPGREIPPPLKVLIFVHATAMTSWVVLLLVQAVLVARGSRRAHIVLGRLGVALAAFMVGSGVWLGIQATRLTPPEARIWGLTAKQFMAVPVVSIVVFGAMVGVAVYHRRRPHIHRPMMLMASLVAIPAAVARIGPLNSLYVGTVLQTIFGPFLWTLVIATLLLVIELLVVRSAKRGFVVSYGCLVAALVLIWQLTTTDVWNRFATLVL